MEILLVFGTRNQTLRCANFLRAAGYAASVADTPLKIYGSCTLSVGCGREAFSSSCEHVHAFSSFAGAYTADGDRYARIF